jgi:beta-glucosidase
MVSAQKPIYQDKKFTVEKRVNDLLKRMTLEEKVGQMCQYVSPEHVRITEKTLSKEEMLKSDFQAFYPGFHSSDIEALIEKGLISSITKAYSAEETNYLQSLAKKSRLKIPLLIARGGVHGDGQVAGTTVYPTPISLASSWDPSLAYKIAKETASEMRANGCTWNFAPNMDVITDPRWGRTGETYGEDPFLITQFGLQMIKGLQEPSPKYSINMLACAKHYIGGGQSVNGTNAAPVFMDERTLREVFFPPFKAAIHAELASIMPAHNDFNGIPCHANKLLLTSMAREENGFKGIYVSDWMDIEYLETKHHVAENMKEASFQAVRAGMDMHMHGPGFLEPVVELVREKRLDEKRIDESVRRILEAKFKLGLFDEGELDLKVRDAIIFNQEHQKTALEAARKTIVLLKNTKNLLPLVKGKYKTILITGPNANNQAILGDWSEKQPDDHVITIVEGLKQIDPGCSFDYFDVGDNPRKLTQNFITEAKEKAAKAELAIVVVGEVSSRWEWNQRTCGESADRAEINLFGLQSQLVASVIESGTPLILVLVNGRPNSVEEFEAQIPAIIEAWEPGCKGGTALAEIIYGEVNPSGKLPITIPRSSSNLLTPYNHKPTHFWHPYLDKSATPLYPFGFGLSYSTYKYENIRLSKSVVSATETITASIEVTNTSKLAGEEIVQLYLRDKTSSVSRPVKELKGFKRIALNPGEKQIVRFDIEPEMLKFHDENMKWILEPGEFAVMIGKSSADKDLLSIPFSIR